jgi:hypothetical protein
VVRNKARIMCKGYSKVEDIDFQEKISPMARMEAIIMFLAFSTHKNFNFYQMDDKYTFFNGNLE